MAVSITASPDPFALTKGGRMSFSFQGSGRYATQGTPAISAITVTGAVTDGTVIAARWGGKTYAIVARTVPSAANEFLAGDGSAGYADSLVEFFQQYFPFREDFTVSRGDFGTFHSIVFTAKQPGPQYNISAPSGIPHITVGQSVLGALPLLRPQYSVYIEIWAAPPGDPWKRIFQAPAETDASGTATIDVGSILHDEMGPDWPIWSFDNPTLSEKSHLRYYIAYGEAFGTPLQIGRVVTDTVRECYFGGADFSHRGGTGFDLSAQIIATTNDAAADKALRFGPYTRYVGPFEPQFLTFLNVREDRASVTLEVILTLDDASQITYTDRYASTSWPSGDKLTYAVGPAQLQVLTYVPDGRHGVEYSVRLKGAGGVYYSRSYRFVLNARYEPYTRYLAYLSSLGAVETLVTYGKGSNELTRFFEQAERYLPSNYTVQDGQFTPYDVALQQTCEVTTGYRSKAELRLWNDFYVSRYQFHMGGTEARPIGLTSKSIKQGKDGDNQYAHSFEWGYLWKDEFFTGDEDDDPDLIGDGPPPPGFAPAGAVSITQPSLVNSVDPTVPDVVRGLTPDKINKFQQAFNWGNHAAQGYLTQATGSALFRRRDTPVSFVSDLTDKPTTLDEAGLGTDYIAKTHQYIQTLIGIRPRLRSWTGDEKPA